MPPCSTSTRRTPGGWRPSTRRPTSSTSGARSAPPCHSSRALVAAVGQQPQRDQLPVHGDPVQTRSADGDHSDGVCVGGVAATTTPGSTGKDTATPANPDQRPRTRPSNRAPLTSPILTPPPQAQPPARASPRPAHTAAWSRVRGAERAGASRGPSSTHQLDLSRNGTHTGGVTGGASSMIRRNRRASGSAMFCQLLSLYVLLSEVVFRLPGRRSGRLALPMRSMR